MSKQTIDAVEKTIREQGYKYCCLVNAQHQPVVPFNRPSSDKNAALKKIAEIRKRLNALPDGMYYVMCKNSFTAGHPPGDMFPIAKGNVTEQPAHSLSQPNIHLHHPSANGDGNKVMTYQEALLITTENATLKAEVAFLKGENVRLSAELSVMEGQLSEEPETADWQKWADNTLPSILPIVDRYFALEEKKLDLKKSELSLKQNGRQHKKIPAQQQEQEHMDIPEPNTEEFEKFLDWVEGLEDKQYMSVMLYLNKFRPEIYEIVYNEFETEEEEEEEEEQQETNGQEKK